MSTTVDLGPRLSAAPGFESRLACRLPVVESHNWAKGQSSHPMSEILLDGPLSRFLLQYISATASMELAGPATRLNLDLLI